MNGDEISSGYVDTDIEILNYIKTMADDGFILFKSGKENFKYLTDLLISYDLDTELQTINILEHERYGKIMLVTLTN